MPDFSIECRDCHEVFVWPEYEQKFYAERDFSMPRRCRACRARRKAGDKTGSPGRARFPAYRGH